MIPFFFVGAIGDSAWYGIRGSAARRVATGTTTRWTRTNGLAIEDSTGFWTKRMPRLYRSISNDQCQPHDQKISRWKNSYHANRQSCQRRKNSGKEIMLTNFRLQSRLTTSSAFSNPNVRPAVSGKPVPSTSTNQTNLFMFPFHRFFECRLHVLGFPVISR